MVLGQEAVADKTSETSAIPVLIERLAVKDGLKDALVSIDAIATNLAIATAIRAAGADYLLAVSQPAGPARRDRDILRGSRPGRPRQRHGSRQGPRPHRAVCVAREVDWLHGARRFPGELRLPGVATIIRVASKTERRDRGRFETRYYVSSAVLSAARAAAAVRSHWAIKNSLHWVLDVTFREDQSRLRTGHGARNMAVVRHFAINLVRAAKDKHSIKLRRKCAGWQTDFLANILGYPQR